MKKKQVFFLVGVVVILGAIFLLTGNKNSTFKKNTTDFSFNKGDRANSIIISEGDSKKLILQKDNNEWLLNNTYKVNKQKINTVLGALKNLKMQSPVSKKDIANLKELLKNNGTSIAIKKNNKTIYQVTYIKHNNRTVGAMGKGKPYYLEIHGYTHIGIGELISCNESAWRDKLNFNFTSRQIAAVEIIYPSNRENSFSVINAPDGPVLFDSEKTPVNEFLAEEVKDYLHFFTGIDFNYPNLQIFKIKSDSILFELNLLTTNKKSISLTSFPLFNMNTGIPDIHQFAGIINNTDTVFLKYSDFDAIRLSKEYFLKK